MTWSARRTQAKVALSVLLAVSLAAAWGRKPPREEVVKVTLRPLSADETMAILQKFPEMVPDYLSSHKNDTGLLKELFPFKEVTSAPLGRVFPGVRFVTGIDFSYTDVDIPYMIAIAGGKRYWMPGEFNRLLFDKGMKVTDNNIVKLAQALLIASICSDHRSCPDITFLSATRSKPEAWTTDAAQLRVKFGEQEEEWHFVVWYNQFGEVSSRTEAGQLIKKYQVAFVRTSPKR